MLLKSEHGTTVDVEGVEAVRLRRRGWTPVEQVEETGPAVPSPDDVKAAWVAYANALSLDVEGLTKAEIIEKVG